MLNNDPVADLIIWPPASTHCGLVLLKSSGITRRPADLHQSRVEVAHSSLVIGAT
jgi:hypothetical protein